MAGDSSCPEEREPPLARMVTARGRSTFNSGPRERPPGCATRRVASVCRSVARFGDWGESVIVVLMVTVVMVVAVVVLGVDGVVEDVGVVWSC
jgi:hypothetical protein